jgi:hypothetical protein
MDYRLDLFNAVQEYGKHVTDDDALLLICYNFEHGDLILSCDGRTSELYKLFNKGATNGDITDVRNAILENALNILANDKDLLEKFKTKLCNL